MYVKWNSFNMYLLSSYYEWKVFFYTRKHPAFLVAYIKCVQLFTALAKCETIKLA